MKLLEGGRRRIKEGGRISLSIAKDIEVVDWRCY